MNISCLTKIYFFQLDFVIIFHGLIFRTYTQTSTPYRPIRLHSYTLIHTHVKFTTRHKHTCTLWEHLRLAHVSLKLILSVRFVLGTILSENVTVKQLCKRMNVRRTMNFNTVSPVSRRHLFSLCLKSTGRVTRMTRIRNDTPNTLGVWSLSICKLREIMFI